jgi:hypothetical protein
MNRNSATTTILLAATLAAGMLAARPAAAHAH